MTPNKPGQQQPNQMAAAVQASAGATQQIASGIQAGIKVKEQDLPRKKAETTSKNKQREQEMAIQASEASGGSGVHPNPASLYKTPSEAVTKAPILSMNARSSTNRQIG